MSAATCFLQRLIKDFIKLMKLEFDLAVYSLDAVLATTYWCADKVTVKITKDEKYIYAEITPHVGVSLDPSFYDTFQSMVVHNQIRKQLEEKFMPLEKIIIEKAFSPLSKI